VVLRAALEQAAPVVLAAPQAARERAAAVEPPGTLALQGRAVQQAVLAARQGPAVLRERLAVRVTAAQAVPGVQAVRAVPAVRLAMPGQAARGARRATRRTTRPRP